MSDDRAAFEAEMKAAGCAYSTDRRAMLYADGETYRSLAWQAGWEMWRAGMRAGIERAAEVCDAIASDKWDQYKGREPYEPMNPNRANPQTQGESDGAAICAGALRTLLVGKT